MSFFPNIWLWDAYMVIYLLDIVYFCRVTHCMNIPNISIYSLLLWIIIFSILGQLQTVVPRYFLQMLNWHSLIILYKMIHLTLAFFILIPYFVFYTHSCNDYLAYILSLCICLFFYLPPRRMLVSWIKIFLLSTLI